MSNETKFTPGPWHIDGQQTRGNCPLHENHGIYIRFLPDQGYAVCEVFRYDRDDAGDGINDAHARANAALIAAAPELYAALEAMLEVCGDDPCFVDHHGLCQTHNLRRNANGDPECQVPLARAALKKARGE